MTTPNRPEFTGDQLVAFTGDQLVAAAVRAAVRDAGWHPETDAGRWLYKWGIDQHASTGRAPSVHEVYDKGSEMSFPFESPQSDPAAVENAIAEAREAGDYATASRLQRQVEKVRDGSGGPVKPSDEEVTAIREAREKAERAQEEFRAAETETERMEAQKKMSAAFGEASNLQQATERRLRGGVGDVGQPITYPEEYQPTSGLSQDQQALLEDEDKPLKDRLDTAMEQGDHVVASLLQTRLEREATT